MRENIASIKRQIRHKEDNILGWEMRIKQAEEDMYNINNRIEEFKPILEEHKFDLVKLKNLLSNRQGVKGQQEVKK